MTASFAAFPVYRFGAFELDAGCRELRHDGVVVELPGKAFSCVLHLIENRQRVVDREELMREVWGHVHLTESVLGQAIRHARQVLGDSGEDQRVIKTVRGFGYRWAAPVERRDVDVVSTHADTKSSRARWPLAKLAAVALVAALIPPVAALNPERRDTSTTDPAAAPPMSDAIALLLPVAAGDAPDDAWIRLGLMEFIANRLRADGQPIVPTDSVVLLLRGAGGRTDANALATLTSSTQARIVLEAEAEREGAIWRVALHTAGDARPAARAVGEDANILVAARIAADDIAIALGRVPVATADATPDLALLEQRINAAMLTQNRELARRLIEGAPDALRAEPAIRFELARVEFYERNADAAKATFEALLDEVGEDQDPVLRARVLNGLAAVHAVRGERTAAEPMLVEAARLLEHRDARPMRDTQGTIWMNLGNIAQERGDLDLASERMARARRMFEATGDVRNLAQLELNVGVVETRRERYADALRRFENAARLHAAIRDETDELKALCYVVQVQLRLLDPAAAEPIVPRIRELLETSTNAELVALAKLSLSDLDYAAGRNRLADRLLGEVIDAADAGADLALVGHDAVAERAERTLDAGDAAAAARIASELASRLESSGCSDPEAEDLGRVRAVLVRARIATGDVHDASRHAAALAACGDGAGATERIKAALAEAEIAAAERRDADAAAAFERAAALADESRTPVRVREVGERYADWLLASGADETRLLRVGERVAGFAERDYAAALVQLRIYRRLGPPAAWRTALARAQRLAGERRIPRDLLPEG